MKWSAEVSRVSHIELICLLPHMPKSSVDFLCVCQSVSLQKKSIGNFLLQFESTSCLNFQYPSATQHFKWPGNAQLLCNMCILVIENVKKSFLYWWFPYRPFMHQQSAHYGGSYRCRLRVFSAATTQVDQTVVDAGCSKDAGPCIHQQSTRLL